MLRGKNGNICLQFDDAAVIGNKLWFNEAGCNRIYCFDIEKGKIASALEIGGETEIKNLLFQRIVQYKNDLYLLPCTAENIYRISLGTEKIESISYERSTEYNTHEGGIFSAFLYKDKIYALNTYEAELIVIDCRDGSACIADEWKNRLKYKEFLGCRFYFSQAVMAERKIYAFSPESRRVLEYDTVSENCSFIEVDLPDEFFWASVYDGRFIYLASIGSNRIMRFDTEFKSSKEYRVELNGKKPNGFKQLFYRDNRIYFVPADIKTPGCISLNDNSITFLNYPEEIFSSCFFEYGNSLYCLSINTGELLINKDDALLKAADIVAPDNDRYLYIKFMKSISPLYSDIKNGKLENKVYYEDFQDALDMFVRHIAVKG